MSSPVWETSKENFQPLKAGRSVRGLATPKKDTPRAVLADTDGQRRFVAVVSDGFLFRQVVTTQGLCTRTLLVNRRDWEQKLQDYAGSDPLDLWTRCPDVVFVLRFCLFWAAQAMLAPPARAATPQSCCQERESHLTPSQVHQVDTGCLHDRWRQGTADAAPGALHSRTDVVPTVPRRSQIPARLDPLRKWSM